MEKGYPYRHQIQIDVTSHVKKAAKSLAASEGVSLKELVLRALAYQYPQLKGVIESDLDRYK